jgi:hypothetical protein
LATYLKAAIHDTKAYRDSKNYRNIPIGYSDYYEIKAPSLVRDYLTCGKHAADSADFYSYMYDDCNKDGFDLKDFIYNIATATVPVFMSQLSPKCFKKMFNVMWGEFGNGTDNAWSGGIINNWLYYRWNSDGIVNYGSTMTLELGVSTIEPTMSFNIGKPTPISNEWASASSRWGRVANITGVKIGGYTPTAITPPCPAATSPAWNLTGDVKLPTLFDRSEPTPTNEKSQPLPTEKKKNRGSSLVLDIRGLYFLFVNLITVILVCS